MVRWIRRLVRTFRRDDREVESELLQHLEMETADLVAQGWSEADARRQARLALGSVERIRTEAREVRRGRWLTLLPSELLWTWRGLRTRRSSAWIQVALVTIATGATATAFSAADAFVFRPAPYPNADRLVLFQRMSPVGLVDYLHPHERARLAERPDLLPQLYSYVMGPTMLLNVAGAVESVRTHDVMPGLFEALGVAPRWGRLLGPADVTQSGDTAILMSESLARRMFGDPAQAVGRAVRSGNAAMHVVGVMPSRFRFPTALEDIWRPLRISWEERTLPAIAMMAPPVTLEDVQQAVAALPAEAVQRAPDAPVTAALLSTALRDPRAFTNAGAFTSISGPRLFTTLFAAAVCLTLIVSFNVAGLTFARSLERAQVGAIQTALGATRWTLVRAALFEDAIVTTVGVLIGIGLAAWGTASLAAALPPALSAIVTNPIDLDVRTIVVAACLAMGSAALTSLFTVWRLSRPELSDRRRRGASTLTLSRSQGLVRYALTSAQVGLSVLLAIVAVLFARSYGAHLRDKGFDSTNLATIQVTRPAGAPRGTADLDRAIRSQLDGHAGVTSFARTSRLLPNGPRGGAVAHLWMEGASAPSGPAGLVPFDVEERYFETVGIRLLAGRTVRAGDPAEHVVVDEAFARRFWPAGDAIGARYSLGTATAHEPEVSEIVGVVSHVQLDTTVLPQGGEIFVTYRALPAADGPLTYVVRVTTPGTLSELTERIGAVADGSRVLALPIDDRYAESYGVTRIAALVGNSFAAIALLVAMVGLYGVLRFVVAGRTHDIGVMMALGAGIRDIRRSVLAPAMVAVSLGLLAGAGAAALASRWFESQLYGVSGTDLATYAAVGLVVVLTALIATAPPVRRAANIDPAATLRLE